MMIIITSECNKFVQKKYKAKHDWVDKMILWECVQEI